MLKCINFNYKYESDYSERILLLEECGFNGVFIYSQYNPIDYVDILLKSSLEIDALHLPYIRCENGKCIDSRYVNVLWLNDFTANEYLKTLLSEVDFAAKYNINTVVMHITGGIHPPPISQIAIDRIAILLERCEKHGIILCLENTRRIDYLIYIFDNISSSNLKFCFDSGHANAMTHNVEEFPWENFGKHLHCLHLNDNNGVDDQHSIPFEGNINWELLIKKIFSLNPEINLTLEIRSTDEDRKIFSEREYLIKCFSSLTKLEKLKG
jgi:sugar phosphate isomerase/epimerase